MKTKIYTKINKNNFGLQHYLDCSIISFGRDCIVCPKQNEPKATRPMSNVLSLWAMPQCHFEAYFSDSNVMISQLHLIPGPAIVFNLKSRYQSESNLICLDFEVRPGLWAMNLAFGCWFIYTIYKMVLLFKLNFYIFHKYL